tara:strand:- start:533 stop:709 length:177 start_codon:yes stop_codon:yes gene_type:complete
MTAQEEIDENNNNNYTNNKKPKYKDLLKSVKENKPNSKNIINNNFQTTNIVKEKVNKI